MIKVLKKIGRLVLLLVLAVVIAANLFILLSGRFYLYKGIANTYLKGKSGPGIYDRDVFAYSTLSASEKPFKWTKSEGYNGYTPNELDDELFKSTQTAALLVFQDDELLYEQYDAVHTPSTFSNSFSAAKTVVAMLVGIAVGEGKIQSLDEPVGNYLIAFQSKDKKDITIRHLLQMASGLDWTESGKNPLSENAESYYGTDLYGLVNRQKGISEPGKVFNYQSGNSQLLGFVVEKATGKSVSSYAQEKLWKKIGASSNAFWSLDKENGDEKAFCCLYATAHDFAKLGRLLLQKGKWGDEQIIPEEFYAEMVQPANLMTEENVINTRYGLHIWLYNDNGSEVIYCRGILGQYIIAIPSENRIIVRLGSQRMKNVSEQDLKENPEVYTEKMLDHPKDFFRYLNFAKRVVKESR